jgi:homoserine dehydrogenase
VSLPPDVLTTDVEAIVTDEAVDIVVEVMGGLEPARSLILKAIAHGKHVVTANKAVIARYGAEIFTAAEEAGVYVLLEAAVGGGIPVIQPLKQSLGVNRIKSVTGIINGTTNYILTRMQSEGGEFTDILADAQKLGYAEADPTADVDGLDAADKIAILASLAFAGRIKLQDVHCEGIRQVSAADIAYAQKLGFVIKLLALAKREEITSDTPESETLQMRVHPTLVPQTHPLASISGVYNAILVEGEPIGQVMFFGPGAGSGPTASAGGVGYFEHCCCSKNSWRDSPTASPVELCPSTLLRDRPNIGTRHPILCAFSHQRSSRCHWELGSLLRQS